MGFKKFNIKKIKSINPTCLKCHPYIIIFILLYVNLNQECLNSLSLIEKLYPMYSILFDPVDLKKDHNNKIFPISKINNTNELDSNIGKYTDFHTVGQNIKFVCPIGSVFKKISCTKNLRSKFFGWKSISSLHYHIQDHCRFGHFKYVPAKYWAKYSKKFCKTCRVVAAKSSVKHKFHFSLDNDSNNLSDVILLILILLMKKR